MQITERKIEELIPYERNAKTHGERQLQELTKSIQRYGFRSPVLIDKNGAIIAGHGRVEAAKRAGLSAVPCVCYDDMTPEEVREYRIADNRLAEIDSDWDFEALDFELSELDFGELNFDWGFDNIRSEDFGTDFSLPDGDKPEMCRMTFLLHNKQKTLIESAIGTVGDDVHETFGNANKNGNALYEVVRQWAEQRK